MAFHGDFDFDYRNAYSSSQFQYSSSINNYACSYNYYSESEPKYIQYYPTLTPVYQVDFFPWERERERERETKFTVSHSTVEFNEPEFAEYDPTPYDGGYDQSLTYGKPLPPSDLTCYPRSLPKSDSLPLDNFSYNSIPSPYGKHDPLPLPLPENTKTETESPALPIMPPKNTKTETESPSLPIMPPEITNTETESHSLPIKPPEDTNTETDSHVENEVEPSGGYSSYEHQNGYLFPYGSGLEAMDICESIFGYSPPCLAKKALLQQQQQMNHCQACDQDSWKAAADYLFGTPLPYHYGNDNYHRSDQISWLQ